MKEDLKRKIPLNVQDGEITDQLYRPYSKSYLYYSKRLNERLYQNKKLFPKSDFSNLTIAINGIGARNGTSAIMSDKLMDLNTLEAGAQCFPLKLYEKVEENKADLFAGGGNGGYTERDGITDYGLKHFQAAYPGASITKEDIFYYVYGLLHSPDYRARFADNLAKQLPRIPCVKKVEDFWAFSEAGRKLGDLHVNYESVAPYPVTYKEGSEQLWQIADPVAFYRVEQMKFGGKRPKLDKSTVIYNANITMTNIPLEAYEYVVNGKSALDWVMERQCVSVDKHNPEKNKGSGIVNDANDYANETMHDPSYPLRLFQRVITVSLETMNIVRSLPKLDID